MNAVAQGNASIGSAHQTIETPLELADALATILRALPNLQNATPETVRAVADLEGVEKDARSGRMPIGKLLGCLNVLGKAEDVAMRAPEAAQHIQTLLSRLRTY